MKTIRYRRTTPDRLSSAILRETAEAVLREGAVAEAFRVTVFERDADEPRKHVEAVYIPLTHRLGVAEGGPVVTWAMVPDVRFGLHIWANDPEDWNVLTGAHNIANHML